LKSYEECRDIARHYTSRTPFNALDKTAYDTARRNGWLDEICAHMTGISGKNTGAIANYSDKDLIDEAKKFSTRKEMRAIAVSAYSEIYERRINAVAFAHMPLLVRGAKKRNAA
jgi:hypothetical protein